MFLHLSSIGGEKKATLGWLYMNSKELLIICRLALSHQRL